MSWQVVAGSAVGTSHRAILRPSDDAYAYTIDEDNNCTMLAIADGAGSQPATSRFAAAAAVRAVNAFFASERPSFAEIRSADGAQAIGQAAAHAVLQQARAIGAPSDEMNTTLSFAILRGRDAFLGQVGDGISVVRAGGASSQLLAESKDGYVNETSFLDAASLHASMRSIVLSDVDSIALSTDGLRYKILDLAANQPYEPFFDAVWAHIGAGTLSDGSLSTVIDNIEDDQTGDDKTLIAAVYSEDRISHRNICGMSPMPEHDR